MTERLVLWDFDGTLAFRPGLWSGCVIEVLDEHVPTHSITVEHIRTRLRDGFPWHRSDHPHPYPGDPERWWEPIQRLIANALVDVGVSDARCAEIADAVHRRFIDPSIGWTLFDDALPALSATAAAGWTNAILSNHVPELPALVAGLGLDTHVDRVFTSALIGYEKPNPEIFRHALSAYEHPRETWMVGDNPIADVAGAEAAGLRAVLVRSASADPPGQAVGLRQASEIILAG